MQPFVLHAHFYQPERLNPWTGALDPEPSAAPARDWNERILAECYRPNGTARIFDSSRRVERIVNNYAHLSFNFGPTLLSWMEHAHPDTYAKVLDGDRVSLARTGHGNALAQAYNHMILPLANARDIRTQITWGLADFRHRFKRDAEGLWLPEAAVNLDVVDALIDAGVAFIVLAPYQAARVRERGGEWRDTPGGHGVDSGRPYRHAHSDGSGRTLAVFFYDGALAQGLAFDPATADAAVLLERLQGAGAHGSGLIHAALDGETFGHHHAFGELGLAYLLFALAQQRGFEPTNYAAYLAANPPTVDVEVVGGEGTAWSCAHGVGRWYRDCGCSTDALPGWNQAWRTPVRDALDVVREAAVTAFERRGPALFADPWAARDDYVHVRLGSWSREEFLRRHARPSLRNEQEVVAWSLLEMQRNAMVMYTSCGWFFADVSGIETVYVLRFAARVLGLLAELGEPAPTDRVVEILATARSNKEGVGTGADVWRTQVLPAAVTPTRVAAHLLLLGMVTTLPEGTVPTAGHVVDLRNHRLQTRGRVSLTTAHMTVTSATTGRRDDLALAAVHLGGLDFYGIAAPYPGDDAYAKAETDLWTAFPTAPVAQLLRLVADHLVGEEFGLDHVLPDGRQQVVGAVFSDLTERFHEQYSRLYHDHRRILEMLTSAGYELPRDLRAAAELTLGEELEQQLADALADGGGSPAAFESVRALIAHARTQGYHLDLVPLAQALTDVVTAAAANATTSLTMADADALADWLRLCRELGIDVDLSRAQERAYDVAVRARTGRLSRAEREAAIRVGTLVGLSPVAWTA